MIFFMPTRSPAGSALSSSRYELSSMNADVPIGTTGTGRPIPIAAEYGTGKRGPMTARTRPRTRPFTHPRIKVPKLSQSPEFRDGPDLTTFLVHLQREG